MKNIKFNDVDFSTMGIDIATLPEQSVEIPVRCEPKVKCRNKFLQKIFAKIFGYKVIYETKQAKVLTIKAEDCPKDWDGEFTFTMDNKTTT